MILGLTEPVVADYYHHGPGDRFGASVVKYSLVEAALSRRVVDGVHLFTASRPDVTPGVPVDGAISGIVHRTLDTLRDDISRQSYVFLTHGVDFAPLGQFRLSLDAWGFPICALIHSINAPSMLGTYTLAALFARSFDAVVVTSRAGLVAVERLFDDAITFLELMTGGTVTERPLLRQIPLGVDATALVPRNKRESREILRVPSDRFVLVFVGRLTEREKGKIALLIDILSALLSNGVQAHLLLAGSTADQKEYHRLRSVIDRAGVWERVTIAPDFAPYAKSIILSAADVYVAPADNVQETFGLALVEAAACGLPVVASDWSGYRDVVAHGETGFLVPTTWSQDTADLISPIAPLADVTTTRYRLAQSTGIDRDEFIRTLLLLASDDALRVRCGRAARARVETQFDWEAVLPRLHRLWECQIEHMRLRAGRPARSFVLDYHSVFGQFASSRTH